MLKLIWPPKNGVRWDEVVDSVGCSCMFGTFSKNSCHTKTRVNHCDPGSPASLLVG